MLEEKRVRSLASSNIKGIIKLSVEDLNPNLNSKEDISLYFFTMYDCFCDMCVIIECQLCEGKLSPTVLVVKIEIDKPVS